MESLSASLNEPFHESFFTKLSDRRNLTGRDELQVQSKALTLVLLGFRPLLAPLYILVDALLLTPIRTL